MQIYNVKEGKHHKTHLSQKYGCAHAVFSHASGCIIHSSTKINSKSSHQLLPIHILNYQTPYDTSLPMTIHTFATSKAMRKPSRASPSTPAKTTSSPAAKTTPSASGTPPLKTPAESLNSTVPTSPPGIHPETFSL